MNRISILPFLAVPLIGACGHPAMLQRDHGRAYAEAFSLQADLERATVRGVTFPLDGFEGLKLRERQLDSSTDKESGKTELDDATH